MWMKYRSRILLKQAINIPITKRELTSLQSYRGTITNIRASIQFHNLNTEIHIDYPIHYQVSIILLFFWNKLNPFILAIIEEHKTMTNTPRENKII